MLLLIIFDNNNNNTLKTIRINIVIQLHKKVLFYV